MLSRSRTSGGLKKKLEDRDAMYHNPLTSLHDRVAMLNIGENRVHYAQPVLVDGRLRMTQGVASAAARTREAFKCVGAFV